MNSKDNNPYGQPYQQPYNQQPYYNQSPYGRSELRSVPVSSIMTNTFLYMFLALLVTGITAMITASSQTLLLSIYGSDYGIWLLCIGEIALVIGAETAMSKNNLVLSVILFFGYAIVNGLTMATIFLAFSIDSIAQTFLVTAVVFGVMAFLGATTKKDLSSLGSLLMGGLFAIILVSLVNFFLKSSSVDYLVSIIGVVIFIALTAYDTQKIRRLASSHTGYSPTILGLWGAMELYLDFINLFLKLLRLFGRRSN